MTAGGWSGFLGRLARSCSYMVPWFARVPRL
jgi:hypothetical protein